MPTTESPTTAVDVAAPERPDDTVRAAAWVDPSSFMSPEQARTRDHFLNRVKAAKEKQAADRAKKKDLVSSQGGVQTPRQATPSPDPPLRVAYPSPAPLGATVPSPHPEDDAPLTSAAADAPSTAPNTQRPVYTSAEVLMGSFAHEPVAGPRGSGAGWADHQRTPSNSLRYRRRRRERPPRATEATASHLSHYVARQLITDNRAWCIYTVPPSSYYVASAECAPDITAEIAKQEVARRANIDALLARDTNAEPAGGAVRFLADPPAAGSDQQPVVLNDQKEREERNDHTRTLTTTVAANLEDGAQVQAQPYDPMRAADGARQPPPQHGRILEAQRYTLPRCPPYRIPLYDQACFKHIFPNLFDTDFHFMEMFYWVINLILVIVQIIMVIVNLFFNDPQVYLLPWVRTASTVIFSVEFGVTMALVLFMVATIAHASVTKNVGTKLAQDVAALTTFIGTFSILRAVGLASPSFAMRRIWPRFQHAISFADVLIGFGMVVLWLAACLLAFVALIIKVTQIDFAYSSSITDWTFVQFVQLIGLLMNLARVDDSYYKEISVLLDAAHHHFSTPGEAREARSMERPCLLARLLRALRIPNYMYYEYFDAIFNYHMDWARFERADSEEHLRGAKSARGSGGGQAHSPSTARPKKRKKTYNLAYQGQPDIDEAYTFDEVPMRMRWRNMLTYLSFVFEIDTVQLRRYLQMVQSPLPFYRVGRQGFLMSFAEVDPVGMDMAVWRSDPVAARTRRYAKSDPDQFNLKFVCEDRRDVWDPNYKDNETLKEAQHAADFAKALSRHNGAAAASTEPVYKAVDNGFDGGEDVSSISGVTGSTKRHNSEGRPSTEGKAHLTKLAGESDNGKVLLDLRLLSQPVPDAKHDQYDQNLSAEALSAKRHFD